MVVICTLGGRWTAAESYHPGAAIRQLAQEQNIPMTGFAQVTDRAAVVPGDRCVALVSLREGGDIKQWLLDFEVVGTRSNEAKANDPTPPPFYTSSGRRFEFGMTPVAMKVAAWGPLDQNERRPERAVSRVKVKQAGFLANEDYLGLGFDRMAATVLKLRRLQTDSPVGFSMRGEPFPEEQIRVVKAAFAERGVTEADERSIAGAAPALGALLNIVQGTPGLSDILAEVVDIPWWSLIKSGGRPEINLEFVSMKMARQEASSWEIANGREVYTVPFNLLLNGKIALEVALTTLRPQPPELALAGIVKIRAATPGKQAKRVLIQLLATRAGEPVG